MSRSSVFDKFFKDMTAVLNEIGVLKTPDCIYNIDESWLESRSYAKKAGVLSCKGSKVQYKVSNSTSEHVTLTMCICADGAFLPPMVTYTSSLPSTDDFFEQGPKDTLYTCTKSGHIDSHLYLSYIKHLDHTYQSSAQL